MTISRNVYNQLFEQAPDSVEGAKEKIIRLRPTEAKAGAVVMSAKSKIQMWTKEEHERFLAALEKFPAGPWKKVADFIGTKTPRQTMTHAQKYRQKIHRRQRGLRNQKKNSNSSDANPAPVDTKAAVKGEPKNIVSPYGVADLQLKPGSVVAAAAAAGATSDQLLNILAQQATTIQDKPEPMEVDSAATMDEELEEVVAVATEAPASTPEVVDTADATAVSQGSPNTNLPSLAEILHLSGEGQAPTEQAQSPKKDEDKLNEAKSDEQTVADKEMEGDVEKKTVSEETTDTVLVDSKPEAEPQIRPEDCAHGGQKPAVEETMQPQVEEI